MDNKQKKHAGDELLDAVIKNAFTEVFQKEMEELEAEAPKFDDKRPQEEYLKIERQAYKKTQRKPINFWSVSRRIVASILVVLGLGGIILFCVPEVKASVLDTVVEFFENYVGFDFSTTKTEIQLGEHTLYYLPKGYTLTDKLEMSSISKYTFTNDGNTFILHCMKSGVTNPGSDDENRTVQTVEIHDSVAYALIPTSSEEVITVVWGNESQSFMLQGNLSLRELIKTAKSLK